MILAYFGAKTVSNGYIFEFEAVILSSKGPSDLLTNSEVSACISNHEVGAQTAQERPI